MVLTVEDWRSWIFGGGLRYIMDADEIGRWLGNGVQVGTLGFALLSI